MIINIYSEKSAIMYGYTIFHEKVIQPLIDSVRNGTASHTYIFEGAKGMYKEESAKLFANTLICQRPNSAPCGECPACVQARLNSCPDIILVQHDLDSNGKPKKTIGVEAVRALVADVQKKPFESKNKVYIIPDGENLTVEAQNALLKTLEEPPEYAVFIIIIPSENMLLPTIVSRSATVSFNAVTSESIYNYVMKKYPQKADIADFIAKYSEGVPGTADSLASDDEFMDLRNRTLAMMEPLISHSSNDAFKIRDFIEENKDKTKQILDIWLSFIRDISVIQCGNLDGVINSDKTERLRQLCPRMDLKRCIHAAELIVQSEEMLARYVKSSAVALRLALLI